MLFSKIKDNNNRLKYLKLEHKIKLKKFIKLNLLSRIYKKKLKSITLISLLKNKKMHFNKCTKTSLIRHCLLTNKIRNVPKKFNLSRSVLRELILFGVVPGFKKAVW